MVTLADVQAEKARRASTRSSPSMNSTDDLAAGVLAAVRAEKERRRQQSSPASSTPPVEQEGVLERFGSGAVRGLKSRALGITQAVTDALPDSFVSPETKGDMEMLAKRYNQEGKGTGVAGTAGEIIGDPLTYLPLPGKAASLLGRVGRGAVEGSVSGATAPLEKGDSRTENAAIGGAAGGALPVAFEGVRKVKDAVTNIPDSLRSVFGSRSEEGSKKVAEKYIAKTLAEKGMTAEELAVRAKNAQAAGLGATLPEYTGSNTLLSNQKTLAKGGGNAADHLTDYAEERAKETIPGRLKETAAPLVEKTKTAGRQYDKLFQENNVSVDIGDLEKNLSEKIAKANPGSTKEALYKGLLEKLNAAKERGGTLEAFHNAKIDIDAMIKKEPSNSLQRILKKNSAETVDMLRQAMDKASPEYGVTRRLYEEGTAGGKILKAVKKNKIGSIAGLKDKLFGTEEKVDELRKSMHPDEFRGLTNIMNSLDDIAKGGLSGSDTAFNIKGQKLLEEATGAQGVERATEPLKALPKLAKWYSDKARQRDYEAIAKVFTDPDIKALGKRLRGLDRKSPKARKALDEFATKVLAVYAGREGADE